MAAHSNFRRIRTITEADGSPSVKNAHTIKFANGNVTDNGDGTVSIADQSGAGGVSDGDKGDITVSGTGTTWTIDNDAVTYAKMQNISATDRLLGRDTAAAGDTEELTVGGGLEFTGSGGIQRSALTGNVTATAGSNSTTIANGVVTDAMMLSTADVMLSTITFIIDGGGSAITTGVKGDLEIPFACTINRATLLADQSGSIVIDIWKDTYANFPPTVADTITASAKPTLSTAAKSQDSTLTGWTTSIAAGDTLRFNVDSITTCTRVTLSLKVTKT